MFILVECIHDQCHGDSATMSKVRVSYYLAHSFSVPSIALMDKQCALG